MYRNPNNFFRPWEVEDKSISDRRSASSCSSYYTYHLNNRIPTVPYVPDVFYPLVRIAIPGENAFYYLPGSYPLERTVIPGENAFYYLPRSSVIYSPSALARSPVREAVATVGRQKRGATPFSRPKNHRCNNCEASFSNKSQLTSHMRIHTGERPFKCNHTGCGKDFTRKEELTRHNRIHTGEKPYVCTICLKKFGRKDHLNMHQITHSRK